MARTIRAAALAAVSVCISSGVFAHSPVDAPGDLTRLITNANLIFVGEVAKIEYKNLQVGEGEPALPHTIVTYRIRETVRGKAPGESFTMRFVGGPDGMGRFLTVSGVPRFQEGDRDVLFVDNNGAETCPLVLCEWGRFRILDNAMYDTEGAPVRGLIKNNAVARGMPPAAFRKFKYPAPSFDDLMKNPEAAAALQHAGLSIDEARRRFDAEAPKTIEILTEIPSKAATPESDSFKANPQNPKPSVPGGRLVPNRTLNPAMLERRTIPVGAEVQLSAKPVSLERFLGVVKELAGRVRRVPVALKSLDPNAPVKVHRMTMALPATIAEHQQPQPQGADEAAERKAYEAQGENPVLKH